MIDTFSDRQMQVLSHAASRDTACLAGGSVRSGKTTAIMHGFAIWLLSEGMDHQHALVGQSLETVMRNMGFDLLQLLQDFGAAANLTRDLGTRITVRNGGRSAMVWIVGASDERARRRLQGATLKGLVIEELTLLPESFFNVAWGRLSVDGAKMWGSYNPDNPRHWAKLKVVDRIAAFNGVAIEGFRLEDNPSLTDETRERYDASFTGHWHRRMILGQWAGAAGLIFPDWHLLMGPPLKGRLVFSLDWGVSTVFHALCFSARGARADCIAEMVYDGRETGPRTEAEHVEAFTAWAAALAGSVAGVTVWMDPSTPASFKRLLRARGMVPRNADNAVLPGLVTTATRLAQGEILIGDCPALIRDMGGYVWDERKSELGEDAPTKANDHGVDALRYYAYSTGKAYRGIAATTARQAMGA